MRIGWHETRIVVAVAGLLLVANVPVASAHHDYEPVVPHSLAISGHGDEFPVWVYRDEICIDQDLLNQKASAITYHSTRHSYSSETRLHRWCIPTQYVPTALSPNPCLDLFGENGNGELWILSGTTSEDWAYRYVLHDLDVAATPRGVSGHGLDAVGLSVVGRYEEFDEQGQPTGATGTYTAELLLRMGGHPFYWCDPALAWTWHGWGAVRFAMVPDDLLVGSPSPECVADAIMTWGQLGYCPDDAKLSKSAHAVLRSG